MARSVDLTPEELVYVSHLLSELLRGRVKFAIIGGAACSLHRVATNNPYRATKDIDLVIEPTRNYNAESISDWLATRHPGTIRCVEQYGVKTPAIPIYRARDEYLVEIEIFDVEAWPDRQQYDLANSMANPTTTVSIARSSSSSGPQGSRVVEIPVMHPKWLLREKILSQFERQGSQKEISDLLDIATLLNIVEPQALVLSSSNHIMALRALIAKRPDLVNSLRGAISCRAVFRN